ncbi:MAG: Gfo/Idh/MocA family oxidoreductase [Winogradskyella sp.]|uniref:Gfo/Idh/MocA family protein n=1 Tax=Winogradskyella sp. TaxID=1883156 RepID=UPI0025DEEBF0|nr:Gfo/Idh/MocA family oxidoreductase [Winogradskyella sp.]NRB61182.1 Gfo/Idh/MocA family oxidoreductase [Winogradskyella sp.]
MALKTIRWGIIGAGKIAKKFAQDLNTIPDAQLYAIASRDITRAKKFASDFSALKSYGSYEELALDNNIDAVYIATPHSFHKAHSILCLEHKIPVLCEKPFAMNLSEVEEMISIAKSNNILLMEAMWTAFLPHFQYTLDLLNKKHFGEIVKLEADFGFFTPYNTQSRLFNKSVGGGSLLDIGIYPIFVALSSLGVPNTIEAKAEQFPNGADSECDMIFHYDNAKANLKSTLTEETKTEATFHCEHGTIKINGRFHQPSSVTLTDNKGNSEIKTFDYKTIGYSHEIEHFNQLIRTNKTVSDIMTFEKSRTLISTIDRVREKISLKY